MSARAFILQLPRLVQSVAECVVALSSFAHRFGSDACRDPSRRWSMIMSRGRSPSRRSRSWALRKGHSRHRRDRERIFIICVCSQRERHFATRPKRGTIGASEAVHFRALRLRGVEGRSTSHTQAYPLRHRVSSLRTESKKRPRERV